MLKKLLSAAAVIMIAAIMLGCGEPYELVEETYTVQSGDDIWSIGEQYIVKNTYGKRTLPEFVEGIKQLNDALIQTNGHVEPGQVIRINYWVARN